MASFQHRTRLERELITENISSEGSSDSSTVLLLKFLLFKENMKNLFLWFSAHEGTAEYVGRAMVVFPGNLKSIVTEQQERLL